MNDECEILVLKITDYSETSQIVTGLSAKEGLVKFFSKGGRRLSKKNYPIIGLFRHLSVVLKQGRGDLKVLESCELLGINDHLARNWNSYQFALTASSFLANNLPEGVAQEELFDWLVASWSVAHKHKELHAWQSGLMAAYVYSQGLLSLEEIDSKQRLILQKSLDLPLGEDEISTVSDMTWTKLYNWLKQLVIYYELSWPETTSMEISTL